jgi:predicted Rossmann fold nucleotide-binding protein DprA/Smf involved in DNA uptake
LTSEGTNILLKHGAIATTSIDDILAALGVTRAQAKNTAAGSTPAEQALFQLIARGEGDGDTLLALSNLPLAEFSQALTMLEINGSIRNEGNNRWSLN